jgi:hypothetical protein
MPTRVGSSSGYFGNLSKELKQYGRAYMKASDASAGIGPGADKKAFDANEKQRQELGQLLGAFLQGRRYNKKGKQK